jgi:hypothetical protein
MSDESTTFLDGNAAAGELRQIFAVELTSAMVQCDACGVTAHFGEARYYESAPGVIVRCRFCEAPLLRMTKSPTHTWIDLRGLRYLQLETPSG